MRKGLAKTGDSINEKRISEDIIITKLIIDITLKEKRWNLPLIDTHVPIVDHTYARFFLSFSFIKS